MNSETVVCVGAVVLRGNAVLAIRQAKGHSLEGQWTIPWGRLDDGESPVTAVLREVSEEAGVAASVQGLLGVQELPNPQRGWIALVYLCNHDSGDPTPDNRETDAARYVSAEELDGLGEPIEPWSKWLMRRVLSGEFTVVSGCANNPYNPEIGFV